MKTYTVMIDKLYSYRLEVRAENEVAAEATARLVVDDSVFYDFKESTYAVEVEEVN